MGRWLAQHTWRERRVLVSNNGWPIQHATRALANSASCRQADVVRHGSATSIHSGRWGAVPNWCSLCVEPISGWLEHVGKRDHMCLEMVLEGMMNSVLPHSQDSLFADIVRSVDVRLHPDVGTSVSRYYHHFDGAGPIQQREELHACISRLHEVGLLPFHNPQRLAQASFEGGLVLFKETFAPLAVMFPTAQAGELSSFTQLVASPFNLETVHDLCRMEVFAPRNNTLPAQPMPEAQGGDAEEGEFVKAGEEGDGEMHRKAAMCRAILGALRWSVEPQSTARPPALLAMPAAEQDCCHVLAAHTVHLLIAQILFFKMSEFVVRLGGVYHRERIERDGRPPQRRPRSALSCTGAVVPRRMHLGMLSMVNEGPRQNGILGRLGLPN